MMGTCAFMLQARFYWNDEQKNHFLHLEQHDKSNNNSDQ
jgi:hypothetical protein